MPYINSTLGHLEEVLLADHDGDVRFLWRVALSHAAATTGHVHMPAALTLHVEYVDRVYLPPDKETGWYQALFSAKYPRQQCEKTFTGLPGQLWIERD